MVARVRGKKQTLVACIFFLKRCVDSGFGHFPSALYERATRGNPLMEPAAVAPNPEEEEEVQPQGSNKWITGERFDFLCEHGWLVVPGVVSAADCDRARAEMIAALEACNPALNRSDPSTWTSTSAPPGTIHGINRLYGHLPFQWRLRQHPNVAEIYTEYWRICRRSSELGEDFTAKDLVVSFDAFNYYRAEQRRVRPSAGGGWCHTDQGPHPPGAEPLAGWCLQGYVNLEDSMGPNDGTLVVYDKGHRAHGGYFRCVPIPEAQKASKTNWHRFNESWLAEVSTAGGRRYLDDCDPERHGSDRVFMARTRVHAPKGAMVLWFSKTPHENQAPFPLEPGAPVRDRAVQYICMTPRDALTARDISARRQGWEEQRQSNHWASAGQFSLFARVPRIYNSKDSEAQKAMVERAYAYQRAQNIELTELGRSLLGVSDEPPQQLERTKTVKRRQATIPWVKSKSQRSGNSRADD